MWGEKSINSKLTDRIKRIRQFYDVTVKAIEVVSEAMGEKISCTAVNRWELGRTSPNSEMLLAFANIFGVDMYWLLGQTDEPFNESVLLSIERKILASELGTDRLLNCLHDGQDITLLPYISDMIVSDDYIDEAKRKDKFSLSVRSTIIFMLNMYKGSICQYFPDIVRPVNAYNPEMLILDPYICNYICGKSVIFNKIIAYLHAVEVINDPYISKRNCNPYELKAKYDLSNL